MAKKPEKKPDAPAPETPKPETPPVPPVETPAPETPTPPVETISAAALVPAESPTVNEAAIAAHANAPAPTPEAASEPETKRKPGRPLGSKTRNRSTPPPLAGVPTSPPPPALGPDRFETAAELYCQGFYAITGMLAAAPDEWKPDSPDEHGSLKSATAAYLRYRNDPELPPSLGLILAVGLYSAPRLVRPKTAARISALRQKLADRKKPAEKEADKLPESKPETPPST